MNMHTMRRTCLGFYTHSKKYWQWQSPFNYCRFINLELYCTRFAVHTGCDVNVQCEIKWQFCVKCEILSYNIKVLVSIKTAIHNLKKRTATLISYSKSKIYRCSPPYCIVARYATVIGLRGQHHVELCFIGSSLSFVPGVEGQAQWVVVTQVNLGSVTERRESPHRHFFCVCVLHSSKQ